MADIKRTIDQLTKLTDPTSGVFLIVKDGISNSIDTSDVLKTEFISSIPEREFVSSEDKIRWNDMVNTGDFEPGAVTNDPGGRLKNVVYKGMANQAGGYASLSTSATVLESVIPMLPESRITNLVQDLANRATTGDVLILSNTVTGLQQSLAVTATNLSNAITGVQYNLSVTATNLSSAINTVQNNLSVTAANLSNSVTALQAADVVLSASISAIQNNLSVSAAVFSNSITALQAQDVILSNNITAGDMAILAAVSGVSGGNLSDFQLRSERDQINGYPSLDVGKRISASAMPYHAVSHQKNGGDTIIATELGIDDYLSDSYGNLNRVLVSSSTSAKWVGGDFIIDDTDTGIGLMGPGDVPLDWSGEGNWTYSATAGVHNATFAKKKFVQRWFDAEYTAVNPGATGNNIGISLGVSASPGVEVAINGSDIDINVYFVPGVTTIGDIQTLLSGAPADAYVTMSIGFYESIYVLTAIDTFTVQRFSGGTDDGFAGALVFEPAASGAWDAGAETGPERTAFENYLVSQNIVIYDTMEEYDADNLLQTIGNRWCYVRKNNLGEQPIASPNYLRHGIMPNFKITKGYEHKPPYNIGTNGEKRVIVRGSQNWCILQLPVEGPIVDNMSLDQTVIVDGSLHNRVMCRCFNFHHVSDLGDRNFLYIDNKVHMEFELYFDTDEFGVRSNYNWVPLGYNAIITQAESRDGWGNEASLNSYGYLKRYTLSEAEYKAIGNEYWLDASQTSAQNPYIIGSNEERKIAIYDASGNYTDAFLIFPRSAAEGGTAEEQRIVSLMENDTSFEFDYVDYLTEHGALPAGVAGGVIVMSYDWTHTSWGIQDPLNLSPEHSGQNRPLSTLYPGVPTNNGIILNKGCTYVMDAYLENGNPRYAMSDGFSILFNRMDSGDGWGNGPSVDRNGWLKRFTLSESQYENLTPAPTLEQAGSVLTATATGTVEWKGADIRPNGLETPSDWNITYSPSARTFTVTPVSGTAYWINNERVTVPGSPLTLPAHANTTGSYFLYFDENQLRVENAPWDLNTTVQLAYAYYNAASASGMLFDERHPSNSVNAGGMSNVEHRYHHLKDGTQFISGLTIGDWTTASTSASSRYSVSSGLIVDEDIWTTINALPASGSYRVMYRTGATTAGPNYGQLAWEDNAQGIMYAGGQMQYNKLTGTQWSLSSLPSNNDYVNYYLIAMPRLVNATGVPGFQIVAMVGQNFHTTLGSAQAESPATLDWGGNNPQEFIIFAKLIYQRVPSNQNYQIVERVYLRSNSLNTITSGSAPSDHQGLSNRTAIGAHPATSISFTASAGNYTDIVSVQEALQRVSSATIDGKPISGNQLVNGGQWLPSATNMFAGLGNTGTGGGSYNIAVGYNVLEGTAGNYNIGLGSQALKGSNGAAFNIAIGSNSLGNIGPGAYNVAIGENTLINTKNNGNTAVGYDAYLGSTGATATVYNTAMGHSSGRNTGVGDYNSFFGAYSGVTCSGSNNTFIGYAAGRYAATGSNRIIIDNRDRVNNAGEVSGAPIYITTSATAGATQIVNVNGTFTVNNQPLVSGASISATYAPTAAYPIFTTVVSGSPTVVNVAPTALYFNAASGNLAATQFTSLSDRNYKENIENIQGASETISQLQGVSFNWKENGNKSYGVIAQDIEQVIPETVFECMNMKSVNYDMIIAFLIESNKELQKRIEFLEGK